MPVTLALGANFQAAVDANAAGTAFIVAAGVHRHQKVNPKNGMTFTGQPGAIMSGARVLSSFTPLSITWYIDGQTQQGTVHPNPSSGFTTVLPGFERDNFNEELFIDGVPMRHVANQANVSAGKWFFDYTNDRIYIGDNPAGKLVETSVTDFAFWGTATGVVIDNLTIRHYASPAHGGAISARFSLDWTIRNCDVSYNHGGGAVLGVGSHLHNCKITYNGQIGFLAWGNTTAGVPTAMAPMVVEDNEIAYNRRLGYAWGYEGGGFKILLTTGTIVRNNWMHHNRGAGIWFDGVNFAITIVSNLTENNCGPGIFYETGSGPTVIKWNTSRNDGLPNTDMSGSGVFADAAAFYISQSKDVEIFGNAIDVAATGRGILVKHQARENDTSNNNVHHNDIRMPAPTQNSSHGTGFIEEDDIASYYTSKGIVFESNTYRLTTPGALNFHWSVPQWASRNFTSWQSFGNDSPVGTLLDASQAPSLPTNAVPFTLKVYGPGATPGPTSTTREVFHGADLVAGATESGQTFTESFDKGDSDTLGPDLTWAEIFGDVDVVGNAAQPQAILVSYARAEVDLTADHFAEIVVSAWGSTGNSIIGPAVRMNDATDVTGRTAYWFRIWTTGVWQLLKFASGAETTLASGTTGVPTLPFTMTTRAIGSTIKGFINGIEFSSVINADLPGSTNKRCGFMCYLSATTASKPSINSFTAGSTNPAVAHSADLIALATSEVSHSVDLVAVATTEVSHGADLGTKATSGVSHSADLVALATFEKSHAADLVVIGNRAPDAPTLDYPTGTTYGDDTWGWTPHDPDLEPMEAWALRRRSV